MMRPADYTPEALARLVITAELVAASALGDMPLTRAKLREALAPFTSPAPSFGEWLAARVGPRWVLGRNTAGLRARYPESVIISPAAYRKHQESYRSETGREPY